ncbi:MAG TPA: KamA family radical SAM protein [Kiritimatiellia bacterium]|nr:KamA family radical SAM protein [Kiritimatiellia bacterium]HPA77960.1 KamA family radical SAM protein [Kiritimatiellia bacterium]
MLMEEQTIEKDEEVKNDVPEWIRQDREAIRTVDALAKHVRLTPEESRRVAKACERFQMKIPPYYLSLMDPENPSCPIRKQAIPDVRELRILPSELDDPIGDANKDLNNQPLAAMTHRYPDRVLIYPTPLCGNYCRHCFRRRLAGRREYAPTDKQMEAVLKYVAAHPEVHEVILSGGDPLMLSDSRLTDLLARIKSIPHIRTLRIHSRMPVVNPFRITEELADALRRFQPLWIVTHFNHPVEVTETAKKHLGHLVDRGIPVLNQGVLLKGINDNPETLRELGWKLIEARVKPYYLHHLDRAQGLSHLRVGVRKGLKILRELRGTMPGYAIPSYILDIPEGYGKVPLQYHYLSTDDRQQLYVETPDGEYVPYADMSDEKVETPDTAPDIEPLKIYPQDSELQEKLDKMVSDHD